MRGGFELHDPTSARLGVAVDRLASGLGFTYRGVLFRIESDTLLIEAISPWHGPGLTERQAISLIDDARTALHELMSFEPFSTVVCDRSPRFTIIEDLDVSALLVASMENGTLRWFAYGASPAD